MKGKLSVGAGALAVSLAGCAGADASGYGLKRMYVLDCGRLTAMDQSRWTPGINVGQPREFSNKCYLFEHERGTLLWETGVPDSVAKHRDGVTAPSGAIVWFRDTTLKSQLEKLGMKPEDITYVALSHAHGDHIGNARAFGQSRMLIQVLELEYAMRTTPASLSEDQNFELLSADHDVFGDGTLTIISTPGHTPGHQSLLAKLPETGAIVLTGDLVHFQYMWDNRVVPPFNFDEEQSLASIDRIVRLVAEHDAQLWIGHDRETAGRSDDTPSFHE